MELRGPAGRQRAEPGRADPGLRDRRCGGDPGQPLAELLARLFRSIEGRDTLGPLGYGWSTPWQTTAIAASDGTVTITGPAAPSASSSPIHGPRGRTSPSPATPARSQPTASGGYLLTEADGTVTDYNADGTLNYIQDTNGNRITAGYTGGRLTSLTASSGQSITIAYNAAGLISTVTDSQGRVTTYTYDATNQYLMAVKGFNGQTTTYAYNTDRAGRRCRTPMAP